MVLKKQKKEISQTHNILIENKDYKSLFYSMDTILGINSKGEFKYHIKKASPK